MFCTKMRQSGKVLPFVVLITLIGVGQIFTTTTRATESEKDDNLDERRSLLRPTPYRQNLFSTVSSVPASAGAYRQSQQPLVSTAEEQASLVTGTYGLSGPPLKYVGESAYGAAATAASPYKSEASPNLGLYQPAAPNSYGQQQQQNAPTSYSYGQQQQNAYQTAPVMSSSYGNNKCDQCKSQCSLVSKPSCPYGDGWFQYRDSCYYFEKLRQLPWLQARGFCSLLTDASGLHRGHLVIVNDVKEEQFLGTVARRLIEYGYPDRYWSDGVLVGTELADLSSGNGSMSMTNATNWDWFTLYSLGDRSYYRPNITAVDAAANANCVRLNVLTATNMPPAVNGTAATGTTTQVMAAAAVLNPTGLFYGNEACLKIETPLCEIQLDGALAR